MSPIREVRRVHLSSDVVQPGHFVEISADAHIDAPNPTSLTARLYNSRGLDVGEATLEVATNGLRGMLFVPAGADDGVYEVSLEVPGASQVVVPLVVLSETAQANIVRSGEADQERDRAYGALREGQIEDALEHLVKAETTYRDAGWESYEVDGMLERAFILGPLRPHEAKSLVLVALAKLNRLGVECRRLGSWGRAGMYFRRAKALAEEWGEPKEAAINANNLGEALLYLRFVDTHHLDEAATNFEIAIEYGRTAADSRIEATARENLASVHALGQRVAPAIHELTTARTLLDRLGDVGALRRLDDKIKKLRAVAGRVSVVIDPRWWTVQDLIEGVVGGIHERADERRVEVHVELAEDASLSQVDGTRLARALDSLVANVVRLAVSGTTLVLSARAESRKRHSGVRIEISVSVSGIPPEVMGGPVEPLESIEHGVDDHVLWLWVPTAGP